MIRIHVAMMVRNEAHRWLRRSLNCAQEIARLGGGDVIVTDDASTDSTPEICGEYTSKIQHSDEPLFWRHEGRARQRHLDYAGAFMSPNDWVLSLDADETINDPAALVSYAQSVQIGHNAIGIPLYEFWDNQHYRVDGQWFGTMSSRMFRWLPGALIADKQMASGSEPTYVAEAVARGAWSPQNQVHLLHWGYSRKDEREAKYLRYVQRDGGHGHNNRHVNSIIESPTLVKYEQLGRYE